MTHPCRHARKTPDKAAYIMGGSGHVVTYGELEARSNQCAHLLRSLGLKRGDSIALFMENVPAWFEVVWAAQRSGLFFTAISSRLTAPEVEYIVSDCGAKAVFVSQGLRKEVEALTPLLQGVAQCFVVDGEIPGCAGYAAARGGQPETPLADQSAGADMLYSSGTTGRPKGIKRLLPETAFDEMDTLSELLAGAYNINEETIYLSPAPLYHSAPLRFTMGVMQLGGTVVVMERFDPEEALRQIERYRVTASQWVPTMFIRMLKMPEEARGRHDLSSHQMAIHAAAPCPVEAKERMIGWWGPILHEYYAGTEGNGFCAISSEEWLAHKGSVGRALRGIVHICGEDGAELPVGAEGVIYFESENQFEYHNAPEKTKESRHSAHSDWSTLGDVGRLDEEGYLYLTDRKAFMIISGGVNIYPQEIEDVLIVHPAVGDVAVIGVPNEEFGEEVKAVVEPLDWSRSGEALGEELIAWCRERLSGVKCPRSVDFERKLPRHPTGKLYKRLLRDRYWTGRASRIV